MPNSAALVTGAAGRLGRAMAEALAQRGVNVVVHYGSDAEGALETVKACEAHGVRAERLHCDLLDRKAVWSLIREASEAISAPLDILINNASIFEYDTIASFDDSSWDRHIASNLYAPMQLTQGFADQAPAPTSDGEPLAQAAIINMVDQRVRKLTPEFMTYSIAKAGLWSMTQTTAQALAPKVRVNAIGPGPTLQGSRQSEKHFKAQRAATILERGADAGGIVSAMNYLLDAPAVTGQLICVDGGQHLGWKTPDVLGVE